LAAGRGGGRALLQWQIIFYSREAVLARWVKATDRYPAYVEQVNRAFAAGRPTAIVSVLEGAGPLQAASGRNAMVMVADRYVVVLQPTRPLLQKLGFELAGP
jgi:hypothetical protein